jgi:hypothetical protein
MPGNKLKPGDKRSCPGNRKGWGGRKGIPTAISKRRSPVYSNKALILAQLRGETFWELNKKTGKYEETYLDSPV